MNEYKRLKDVFKLDTPNAVPVWADWTDKGVFTRLKAIAPWTDRVDEKQLNDLYALSRQEKILSPLGVGVYYDMQYAQGSRLSGGSTYVANLAYTKFSEKWTRLWEARLLEYNPIENYNMTESGNDTNTRTGSITRTDTGTVTDLHTGTDTLAKTGSETHTKAGEETLTKSGTETLTKSGTETLTKSGSETLTKSGTETLTKSGTETLTKSGSESHAMSGKEKTTNTVVNNDTGSTNSVFGFNSATAVPSDTSTGTQEGVSTNELEFTNRTNTDSFNQRQDTTGFNQRQDTTGFNQRQDTTDFNQRQDTTGFNDRTDTAAFNNRVDTAGFNNRVDTDAFVNRQDTNTKNLNDTQTRNLNAGETYNNLKDKTDHSLSRSGNIGVTTTQQMLEQELNIWQVFDFFEIVFKDIDSILLLDIY